MRCKVAWWWKWCETWIQLPILHWTGPMSMWSMSYRCPLCHPTGIHRITRCGTCTNGKKKEVQSRKWIVLLVVLRWIIQLGLDACWNSDKSILLGNNIAYTCSIVQWRGKWTLRSNRNQYQHGNTLPAFPLRPFPTAQCNELWRGEVDHYHHHHHNKT